LLQVPIEEYLQPFLNVVRSENTTGPITGVALASLLKFLDYNVIGKFSAALTMCLVTCLLAQPIPSHSGMLTMLFR
jgi:hypothetical protein